MVEVLVEHTYLASQDDELTLQVGDVITDVEKMEDGWWQGTLRGKTGMFPDNFVKEVVVTKEKVRKSRGIRTNVSNDSSGGAGGGGGGVHVAELANKLGKEGGIRMGPAAVKREKADAVKKLRAKVMYSYTPQNDDELALTVGSIIDVLAQTDDSWWEGSTKDDCRGFFPSNFVTLVEDVESEDKIVHAKKVKGVGLGNIFGGGPMALRTTLSVDDGTSDAPSSGEPALTSPRDLGVQSEVVTPVVPESGDATRKFPAASRPEEDRMPRKKDVSRKASKPLPLLKEAPPSSPPPRQAQALFLYTASNSDELSIEPGDVINVLQTELEDSGWWKGELNGKTGVFPDNFVVLISPDKMQKPKKPSPPAMGVNSKGKPLKVEPAKEFDEKPATVAPQKSSPTRHPAISKKPTDVKLIAQTDDHKAKKHGVSPEREEDDTLGRQPAEASKVEPASSRGERRETGGSTVPHGSRGDHSGRLSPDLPPKTARPPPPYQSLLSKAKPAAEFDGLPALPSALPSESPVPPLPSAPRPPAVLPPAPRPPALLPAAQRPSAVLPADVREPRSTPAGLSRADAPSHVKLTPPSESQPCGEPQPLTSSLQLQLTELQTEMANMKRTFTKQLTELTDEIDEEKKTRLMMQVEIDRMRKLISS